MKYKFKIKKSATQTVVAEGKDYIEAVTKALTLAAEATDGRPNLEIISIQKVDGNLKNPSSSESHSTEGQQKKSSDMESTDNIALFLLEQLDEKNNRYGHEETYAYRRALDKIFGLDLLRTVSLSRAGYAIEEIAEETEKDESKVQEAVAFDLNHRELMDNLLKSN